MVGSRAADPRQRVPARGVKLHRVASDVQPAVLDRAQGQGLPERLRKPVRRGPFRGSLRSARKWSQTASIESFLRAGAA